LKTLLITGATGYIGQHLLRLLQSSPLSAHYHVVALSSVPLTGTTTVLHKGYTFTQDDFITQGITHVDVVIHAGAFTPKSGAEANHIDECNSNILRTKYLLDHIPGKPAKVIFLSTLDVYAITGQVIDENTSTQPVSLYGWSKLYGEKLIETWGQQNNVDVQVLRIGHIYGPGEAHYQKLIPVTIKNVLNNIAPVVINGGHDQRSFLYITDCVKIIMAAVALPTSEGVINVTSSLSYTTSEIVTMIMELSGKKIEPVHLAKDIPARHLVFNNTKMRQLLGDETTTLREGLKEEVKNMMQA